MCEVESTLNSRPLTEMTNDPLDAEALTPNHLLLFNAGVTFPPGLFNKDESYYRRRWHQVQYLSNLFWSRWRKEYMILLQQRTKWTTSTRSLKVGDLVLITDVLQPRNQWPLGRIQKVFPDVHGKTRRVIVKVSKCKNHKLKGFATSELERPITKIVLLRTADSL